MKKIITAALVAGFVLGACGSDSDDTTGDTTASDDTTAATEAEPASTDAESTDDCAVDSLSLFADGRLTVGTGEVVYEPWMAEDDPTNGMGYESAFVYALADRMGFEADSVDWVRTTFDEAISPAEKDYDFNLQQYSITAEREEIVDFSHPYYVSQRTVMAMSGSPADGATTFADLADVTWAATAGTSDLDYIENVIGADNVAVFNTQADTLAAMMAGQADATTVNLPTAYYLTAVEIPDAVIAGILPDDGSGADQLGLLFTADNPLVSCVNVAIDAMTDDGTLDSLATEWLAAAGSIPTITE